MRLSVFTPESSRQEEVVKVFFPGLCGSFEVMDNHAAMLAALGPGTIRWVKEDGSEEEFRIAAGFVKIKANAADAMVEAL